MAEYTPTPDEARQVWGEFSDYGGLITRADGGSTVDTRYAEFDRLITKVEAEARTNAAIVFQTTMQASLDEAIREVSERVWDEGAEAILDYAIAAEGHKKVGTPFPTMPANPYTFTNPED